MTAFTCAAAEFLRSHGPAQIPLRACCAAAIIRSGSVHPPGTDLSAPFVCAAAGLTGPNDARLANDPAAAGLAMSLDGRLGDDPAAAGPPTPSDARQSVDPVVVGAGEQLS